MTFNFDLERMRKAVEGGSIRFPRGLKRAKQQFLRDDNKRLGNNLHPKEYHTAECVRGLLL